MDGPSECAENDLGLYRNMSLTLVDNEFVIADHSMKCVQHIGLLDIETVTFDSSGGVSVKVYDLTSNGAAKQWRLVRFGFDRIDAQARQKLSEIQRQSLVARQERMKRHIVGRGELNSAGFYTEKEKSSGAAAVLKVNETKIGTCSIQTNGRIFHRQQSALDFLEALDDEQAAVDGQGWPFPRLFSIEDPSSNGTRKFLLLGKEDLIKFYMGTSAHERHIYEIIQEKQACRIYLDLEFSIAANEGVDGNGLVLIVIHCLSIVVYRLFGILMERTHVVELDSTSESKFSRHLIVHMPDDQLFENNSAVGQVVKEVFTQAQDYLMVRNNNGEKVPFIDLGVYTRNRAFRLAFSCKYKKKKVLIPIQRDKCDFSVVNQNEKESLLEFLESSFVCPSPWKEEKLKTYTILKAPADLECFSLIRNPAGIKINGTIDKADPHYKASITGSTDRIGSSQALPVEFTKIKNVILNYASTIGSSSGCPPPQIRSWSLNTDRTTRKPTMLTINLEKNRFCQRIGRAHRSNNVFYVFDFGEKSFRQYCYDPDCRKWASKPCLMRSST